MKADPMFIVALSIAVIASYSFVSGFRSQPPSADVRGEAVPVTTLGAKADDKTDDTCEAGYSVLRDYRNVTACRERISKCIADEREETFTGTVREISFYLAHSERSGKTTTTVPDKWWLNICETDEQGKCHVLKVTHAPWTWQSVGSKVDLVWSHKCDRQYGWNHRRGPEVRPHQQ